MKLTNDLEHLMSVTRRLAKKIIELGQDDPRALGDTLFAQALEIKQLKSQIQELTCRLKDNDLSEEIKKLESEDSPDLFIATTYELLQTLDQNTGFDEGNLH